MEISILLVHRLRGRHYATFDHWTNYLPGLRKTIIQDIPTDPDKFQGNQGQILHSALPLPLLLLLILFLFFFPLPFPPVLSAVPS